MDSVYMYLGWGHVERNEGGDNKKTKRVRDEGTRDVSSERQTHRDTKALCSKRKRTHQNACADQSSILPFSKNLLRTYDTKLCIQ